MEALSRIVIEFGTPMKLVRKIEVWVNETYNKVHVDKHVSGTFSVQMV
jgi:hypothetical protein